MSTNVNGNISISPKLMEEELSSSSVQNTTYADALRKKNENIEANVLNDGSDDSNLNRDLLVDSLNTSVTAVAVHDALEDYDGNTITDSLEIHLSDCSEAGEEVSGFQEMDITSEMNLDATNTEPSSSEDKKVSPSGPSEVKESLSSSDVNRTENCSSELSLDACSSSSYDAEEESEETVDLNAFPLAIKWQFRQKNPELPDTVTVLDAPGGGKVYLVGTAHFSWESQEDVSKTIRATQPDVVMVELCKGRINILSLDEATVLEESKNMNFDKVMIAIRQNGVVHGLLHLLLLNMSAHLTKELGIAPGGEFRRAFIEAKKVPGCMVQLADRPIHVTLQRALASLPLWKKIRIGWFMLTSRGPISKEEVENCKKQDLLTKLLAEMTGDYPELSQVFVEERDIYLTYSLQAASSPMPCHASAKGFVPTVVVGVVGIGHVPGIVNKWGTVNESDIPPIVSIPKPSLASKVISKTIKYSFYGMLLYGCYRVTPKVWIRKPIDLIAKLLQKY